MAIQAIGRLCKKLNFSDYASRIIHPLARVLDSEPNVSIFFILISHHSFSLPSLFSQPLLLSPLLPFPPLFFDVRRNFVRIACKLSITSSTNSDLTTLSSFQWYEGAREGRERGERAVRGVDVHIQLPPFSSISRVTSSFEFVYCIFIYFCSLIILGWEDPHQTRDNKHDVRGFGNEAAQEPGAHPGIWN